MSRTSDDESQRHDALRTPPLVLMPLLFLIIGACTFAPQTPGSTDTPGGTSESNESGETHRYEVRTFQFEYLRDHPDQPSTDALWDVRVRLRKTDQGFDAPSTDGETGDVRTLRELVRKPGTSEVITLTRDALNRINKAIVRHFNDRGFIGVYARPHPEDINNLGKDLRPDDQSDLRILLHTSEIAEVRTQSRGERFEGQNQTNRSEHEWIRTNSPLDAGTEQTPGDLLNKPVMDRYVYQLSRHSGRRVDVAVGDAGQGRAQLDYVVAENKPWSAFVQASDTGTENTDEVQERAGFIHHQLTGHDDTLRLDYTTADFGDDMNTIQLSYERPFEQGGRTRFRISGLFNEFTASDVGVLGGTFEGDTWGADLGLQHNVFQDRRWFLDVTGGIKWRQISSDNSLTGVSTEDDFIKPNLGLRLERFSRIANTTGSLTVSHNLADLANTTEEDIEPLGRARTEARYTVVSGRASHSFFLEPLIYGSSWTDPSTPDTSTRAHELRLTARGQYAFDTRLIPQESFIAGGMFTVRGYPESAASGDSGLIGSLEYRLHLPRLLPVDAEPPRFFGSPFRFSPENVFGTPDWDLVLSGFLDAGRTVQHDQAAGAEFNETLFSYGVGMELLMLRNVRVQSYYGVVGSSLDSGVSETGDDEVHVLVQLSY